MMSEDLGFYDVKKKNYFFIKSFFIHVLYILNIKIVVAVAIESGLYRQRFLSMLNCRELKQTGHWRSLWGGGR